MQDIFISTLPSLLTSWSEAFPKSTLAAKVPEVVIHARPTVKKTGPSIFWLHMNEDRQQWMENTIALISQNYKDAKVVVLANMPNQAESVHALSLGAMGYCHAHVEPAVLKEIRAVISHGGLWLGQDILQRLIEVSTKLIGNQPAYVENLLAKLTSREKEVAVEAAKGLSNKEIARILGITERTVKAHLAKTFERLGAKDRLQLALMLNSNYKR
jgi:two-component system, NarL family, nitrate/nitrite response regulator NarL